MIETLPSNAGGTGLIPGRGAKILHASRPKNQNIKQKQYCNSESIKTLKTVHIKKKKNFIKKALFHSLKAGVFCFEKFGKEI